MRSHTLSRSEALNFSKEFLLLCVLPPSLHLCAKCGGGSANIMIIVLRLLGRLGQGHQVTWP